MSSFLRHYALGKTLAGALLLIIGLICLAVAIVSLARDLSIWVLGRRTTAEVVASWVERLGDDEEGELTFQYFIRYRFTAPGGQVITKTSNVEVREWSSLGEGSLVTVVYFPLYPTHNRLDEARFVPLLACAYVPLAFLTWAGLRVGWHLFRSVTIRRDDRT